MITTLELVKKGQLNKFLDDIIPNNSNAKTVTLNKKEFEEKIRYKTQLTKQKIESECFKVEKKSFSLKEFCSFIQKILMKRRDMFILTRVQKLLLFYFMKTLYL